MPIEERIAVFDNDGTLWCEQPMPVQGFFTLDRVNDLVQQDPELRRQEPYRSVIEGGAAALASLGKKAIVELMFATHANMSAEQFDAVARAWLARARHPRFGRLFTRCTFAPMLELLELLRDHRFATFIVTGGGVEFVRALAEKTYGIPRHRVIGSNARTRFRQSAGQFDLFKLPELDSFDDGEAKPVNIELHIGRRPILAVGNSDGDLPMLRYAATGPGKRLALLLHHDDAHREYAYDADFVVSPLRTGLAEARERGWEVVSMKESFEEVFR